MHEIAFLFFLLLIPCKVQNCAFRISQSAVAGYQVPPAKKYANEVQLVNNNLVDHLIIAHGLIACLTKTGENTPFRISIYDKREDFAFRIVNFPHMDSNIPANPAYGVYISQLVRNARICTSKVDFINRLRGLSLRLRQQGFETNLLEKLFNKFFSRHGLIIEKYGAALREMRLATQA